ncbi:hypothetical protein Gotur_025984 [Gossypium turneri]
MQCGGGSRHQQERKTAVGLGVKHRKFVALWNDRMGRIPQIVMASDLQPSLEYIQWYSSCGKPYLLGGQSTIVPPHIQRPGDRTQRPPCRRSLWQIMILNQSPSRSPSNHIHMGIHIAIIQIWRAMTLF